MFVLTEKPLGKANILSLGMRLDSVILPIRPSIRPEIPSSLNARIFAVPSAMLFPRISITTNGNDAFCNAARNGAAKRSIYNIHDIAAGARVVRAAGAFHDKVGRREAGLYAAAHKLHVVEADRPRIVAVVTVHTDVRNRAVLLLANRTEANCHSSVQGEKSAVYSSLPYSLYAVS